MIVLKWYSFFIILLISIFYLGNENKETINSTKYYSVPPSCGSKPFSITDADSEYRHDNLNIIPDAKIILLFYKKR